MSKKIYEFNKVSTNKKINMQNYLFTLKIIKMEENILLFIYLFKLF